MDDDLISRIAAYDDMLFAMAGTGYQQRALDVISQLPSVEATQIEQSKWINVKEKLPSGFVMLEDGYKEIAEYIVMLDGATLPTTAVFDGEKFIPAEYKGLMEGTEFGSEVAYWMPLPEPPKGENK